MLERILDKIYSLLTKNHIQVVNSMLYSKLNKIGNNSCIHYPHNIGGPSRMELGDNVTILSYSRLQVFPELTGEKGKICIGDNCFIGYRFTILAGDEVRIGNDVTIASDVSIFSENHGFNPSLSTSYGKQLLQIAPVFIDDGCWIGEKVVILPGVSIGKKSVIGAGTVVNKDIPDFSVAVGNPVRIIKKYNFITEQWEKV